MHENGQISQAFAHFVVHSRWEDIPAPTRAHAVRSILNGFAAALGGSSDAAAQRLMETLSPLSGERIAPIIGRREQGDPALAAFLNAVAMNVFDYDDTHEGTIIHPTAPIAPALFALAAVRKVSGAELLHAFVLGVDVACRIGNAVSPGHYRRGWHITATTGVFGAAAAVGRLIGLDDPQMIWAFGNASAQASGLVETLGTMAKSIGVGNAARNGYLAAFMAKAGVEGPGAPLEGPRGFLRVTCDEPKFGELAADLGRAFEIERNMWKPYPSGVVLFPVIDACLAARRDPRFAPDKVEAVTVAGHPLLKERADRPEVTTGREAQVSAQHAVAVALARGSAGIADFSDAAVADPAVLTLRARVRPVAVDETVAVEGALLRIELAGGEAIETRVAHCSGSRQKPMDDAALEAKFRALAAHGAPGVAVEPLLDALWAVEAAGDAGAVMRLAQPAADRPR